MRKLKVTPWFSGDTKPTRIGVYQRSYIPQNGGIEYCYFDGEFFGCSARTLDNAFTAYSVFGISLEQNLSWRGVMK